MLQTSRNCPYSIAGVSKLTGVSCHALRVWERRYGFPEPQRSPSGHRRYDVDQVRVLRKVSELVRQGRSIGNLMAEVRAGRIRGELGDDLPGVGPSPRIIAPPSSALIDLLMGGDQAGADALFEAQALKSTPLDLLEDLIEPALIEAGDRRYRGQCETFQEHCVARFLRNKLDRMLDAARHGLGRPNPKGTVLVGTAQGDRNDGGILMLSLVLELAGWRAIDVGVDLPVVQFAKAVDAWKPDALAIAFALSRNINKRFEELAEIGRVPIFVSGRSILNYQRTARRHGLIPMTGSIRTTAALMVSRLEGHAPSAIA